MLKPKTIDQLIDDQRAKISQIDSMILSLTSQKMTEEVTLATLTTQRALDEVHSKPRGNPVVLGGGQPFPGSQMVIVEKRNSQGQLDFNGPQPPTEPMTFDDLYQLYFKESKDPGNWGNLRAWLDSKQWVVRAKTW